MASEPIDGTVPHPEEPARWIEVDGRRWRASDPSIPPALRQELVDELMRARRAIKVLRRCDDPELLAEARHHVQVAKEALGERGEPWWEPSPEGVRRRMASTIEALASARAPDRTICPSDAARAIGGAAWRDLMETAREVAVELARRGVIEITQRGEVLHPEPGWTGPVRLRLRRR